MKRWTISSCIAAIALALMGAPAALASDPLPMTPPHGEMQGCHYWYPFYGVCLTVTYFNEPTVDTLISAGGSAAVFVPGQPVVPAVAFGGSLQFVRSHGAHGRLRDLTAGVAPCVGNNIVGTCFRASGFVSQRRTSTTKRTHAHGAVEVAGRLVAAGVMEDQSGGTCADRVGVATPAVFVGESIACIVYVPDVP